MTDKYEHIEKYGYGDYGIEGTRINVHSVFHSVNVGDTTVSDLAEGWDVEKKAIEEAIVCYAENQQQIENRRSERKNYI